MPEIFYEGRLNGQMTIILFVNCRDRNNEIDIKITMRWFILINVELSVNRQTVKVSHCARLKFRL